MKRIIVRGVALLAAAAFAVVAVAPVGPGTTGCVTAMQLACGPSPAH